MQEWNWEINDDSLSKNTSRFFRLEYDGELTETYATSSTSAPKIRLSFNPDLRPSYEDFLDDELNVRAVTSYLGIDPDTGEKIFERGGRQTISVNLSQVNDLKSEVIFPLLLITSINFLSMRHLSRRLYLTRGWE